MTQEHTALPRMPQFALHLSGEVMPRTEAETWERLLAPVGRAEENDVLCVFHKTFGMFGETRTTRVPHALQVHNGTPRFFKPRELSNAERRQRGLVPILAYAAKTDRLSFRALQARFDQDLGSGEYPHDMLHCILPGAVISFPALTDTDLLGLFGPKPRGITARRRIGAPGASFGTLALNQPLSRHDEILLGPAIEAAWDRFRHIWRALLPSACSADLGSAPAVQRAA